MAKSQFEDILRKKALNYKLGAPADLLTTIKATSGVSSATTASSTGVIKTVVTKCTNSLAVKSIVVLIATSTSGYFIADNISKKYSSPEHKIELIELPNSRTDGDKRLNKGSNQHKNVYINDPNYSLNHSLENSERKNDSNFEINHILRRHKPKLTEEKELTSNIDIEKLILNKKNNIANNRTTININTKNRKSGINSTLKTSNSKTKNENNLNKIDKSTLDAQLDSFVIVSNTKENEIKQIRHHSDHQKIKTASVLPASNNNLVLDVKGRLTQGINTEQKSTNGNLLTKNNSKEQLENNTNQPLVGVTNTIENTNSPNLNINKSELTLNSEEKKTSLTQKKITQTYSIENNKTIANSKDELLIIGKKSKLDDSIQSSIENSKNPSKSILLNSNATIDNSIVDPKNTFTKQNNQSLEGVTNTIENTNGPNLNIDKSEFALNSKVNKSSIAQDKATQTDNIENKKVTDSSNDELLIIGEKSNLNDTIQNSIEDNENSYESILLNNNANINNSIVNPKSTSAKQDMVNKQNHFVASDTTHLKLKGELNNNSFDKLSDNNNITSIGDQSKHTKESSALDVAFESEIVKHKEKLTITTQPDTSSLSLAINNETIKKKKSSFIKSIFLFLSQNSTNKNRTRNLEIFNTDSKVEKLDSNRRIWIYPFVQVGTSKLLNQKETESGLDEKRMGNFYGAGLALHYQLNKKLELGLKSLYQEISLETSYLSNNEIDGIIKQNIQLLGIKGGLQYKLLHSSKFTSYISSYLGISYKLNHNNKITGKYFELPLNADLKKKNSLSFNSDISVKLDYKLNNRFYIEAAVLFEYLYINKRTEILDIGGQIGLRINI